jgi:streptogramin lyase
MKKLGTIAATLVALGISTAPAGATPGDVIVGDSNAAVVLRVKPNTGVKSLVSDDTRFVSQNDTVFGPDGTIYVADYGAFGGNGGVFSIDPRTRQTNVVSQDPLFNQPDGIAMGPNGDLYVTDLSSPAGSLFRVELPSGITSLVSDDPLLDGGPVGVVVPPNSTPIVSVEKTVARVNPLTGATTTIADGGDGVLGGDGLTRAPDGTLYVADSTAGIEGINPRSGQVTDLTGPVPTGGYGLALDFQGRVLTQNNDQVYRVNLRNDTFASVATGFDYAEGMEVEPPRCRGLTATIVGTTQRNVLKGSRYRDVIAGIGGRDSIKGKVGNDRLCGGTGNDRIRDAAGKNRIDCGPGRHDVAITNQRSRARNCERLVRR